MIGVDILDLSRIQLKDSFIQHVLTEEEREIFSSLKNEDRKIEFLGSRFSGKEAIFKATQDPHYLSYSILNDESGKPYVKDHPEIEISLSHDGGMAIAMVLVQETQE